MPSQVKAAVIQAEAVYYDLAASVAKATEWISKAAAQGAQIVTFGETWLPGYPSWLDVCPGAGLWGNASTKEVFARLHANSVRIPGPEIDTFREQCKSLGIVLVLNINERVEGQAGAGTLYNTMITIDATGEIVNKHRKLMPTYTERLVWGQGDTCGLEAVPTAAGRVGALICWEHWMPLARQVVHQSDEQIHIATWPGVNEMHQVASRSYAFEGRCYVLAAGDLMRARDLPQEFGVPPQLASDPDQFVIAGGSAIIAPDGRYLAGPVYNEEAILIADLDLGEIVRERMTLDVTGHYSRPELFDFRVKGS
jgi:predicted amidohydrolase